MANKELVLECTAKQGRKQLGKTASWGLEQRRPQAIGATSLGRRDFTSPWPAFPPKLCLSRAVELELRGSPQPSSEGCGDRARKAPAVPASCISAAGAALSSRDGEGELYSFLRAADQPPCGSRGAEPVASSCGTEPPSRSRRAGAGPAALPLLDQQPRRIAACDAASGRGSGAGGAPEENLTTTQHPCT